MKNNPLLESVRPVYTSGQVADKINFEQNVVTVELCPCQRILFLFLRVIVSVKGTCDCPSNLSSLCVLYCNMNFVVSGVKLSLENLSCQ